MPNSRDYVNFILADREKICEFVEKISYEMFQYINTKKESKFVLFYKYLTHSDLATFGKATRPNSHHKNLLYYINESEMSNIEDRTRRPFQTAHQSCIGLMQELYDMVGLPQPRENDPYLINQFMNVLLVNENIEYFSSKYTKKVFDKLGKNINPRSERYWKFDELDIELTDSKFTPINLHCAVHGLGMAMDEDFHKLRHHLFKGDTFILLFELGKENNMFILLEKNPVFYSLIGETNSAYVKYQQRTRQRLINSALARSNAVEETSLEDEVTRQQQSAWRNMLANEMMGYTQVNNQVFCPLTYITADFENLGALFIASHIKGFSDVNTLNEEKYDINNGLLLSANADALFDKHLITISENKELVFSYLLDGDDRLKNQLLLLQPIFKPILNEKRMQYLAYHRQVFERKEQERKRN